MLYLLGCALFDSGIITKSCEDVGCNGDVVEEPQVDLDGDGFGSDAGDCDDSDPSTYPGAPEICDGVDNNCDEQLQTQSATLMKMAMLVVSLCPAGL